MDCKCTDNLLNIKARTCTPSLGAPLCPLPSLEPSLGWGLGLMGDVLTLATQLTDVDADDLGAVEGLLDVLLP